MVALLTTAVVVCALAIAALVYAVWQLRREVDSLSGDLAVAATFLREGAHGSVAAPRGRGAEASTPTPTPNEGATTAATESATIANELGADGHDRAEPEPVAIITELSGTESNDVDLSVSRVASITLAGPLIKVAALSHGLRRALDEDSRMRIGYAVRKELKRQRKMRRRRQSGRAPSKGWTA